MARLSVDRRPRFVAPQLATLVREPPTGPGWITEVKYDGYRIECSISQGQARLLTRNGLDWSDRFPTVARAAERLTDRSAVLDGEIVALDSEGRSSFQALQRYLEHRDRSIVFFCFDLLALDGTDLRSQPLADRRSRLEALLGPVGSVAQPIRLSQTLPGSPAAALRAACRRKLEGIICKRADDGYTSGRTRSWVKVKCSNRQELIVIGYTPPRGSRVAIGALLLGYHDQDGTLRYAGRVGTGMSVDTLRALKRKLEPLRRETTPIGPPAPRLPGTIQWVKPQLVVEVEFSEWTSDGRLRHPSLVGLREDKPASEIRRESP